ncbi:MAG: hypothetical protein ACOYD9_09235 [Pyramidobacter sp.]|jgi:hypothetical protein
MKKFCSFLVITAAVMLAATCASAAPRPEDLTSAFVNAGDWAAIGIRDVQALVNEPADALLARALKLLPAEQVKKYGDMAVAVDMRASLNDESDVDKVALAMEIKRTVTADDFNDVPEFKAEDFAVTAPVGTTITSVGTVDTEEESLGLIYLANLERDGVKYLIGASSDPANLAIMAAAAENTPLARIHTPANLCLQAQISPESLSEMDITASLPFSMEIGIEDTPTSVKAILWTNTVDELNATLNKDLRALFNGGTASKAPLTMGSPLAGLLNISASFLPKDFKLSDLIDDADTVKEIEEEVDETLSAVGLEWSDLVKVLRGNVTLGIAGTLEAPLVGTFPGLCLHLSDMDSAKATTLIAMLTEQMKGLGSEPDNYNADGWKGSIFSAPVSLLLAHGEKGMILAGMNADNFGQTPQIAPALAPAVEPRNFALAFDVKALQPALKALFDAFGDTLDDEDDKEIASMVLDNISTLNALSLVSIDADTFVLEVVPDPAKIDTLLPAAQ